MKRKFVWGAAILIVASMNVNAQTASTKKKGMTYVPAPATAKAKPAPAAPAVKPAPAKPAVDKSEDPLRFGINVEPALPLGDLKLGSNFGFGVSGMVKYNIADRLDLKGSLGYMTFLGKTFKEEGIDDNGNPITESIKPAALHAIMVKGGAAYMLTDNFFAQASIGLAFLNQGGGTAFLYTPGLGYTKDHIELLLKYEGWSKSGGTLSFVGLQIGYLF